MNSENIYILCGLLCVKGLEPRTTVSSTLVKTAKIMFKMDKTCRSVLGDKEYVESLIRNRLLPVSYFLVFNDLILLNKILVRLTSMNASDHWSITFGCPKIRSSKKFETRKRFRKRCEDNFLKRVARFNNSLSQLNSFSNYSSHKNPCQFRRNEEGMGGSEKIQI